MKTNFKIQLLKLFGVLLIITNCSNKKETEIVATATEASNIIEVSKAQFTGNNMELATLERKPFPNIVNATGMIDVPPQNKAVVNAIMGGFIKKTPLLIGNKVTKGQFLVSIENPEFLKLQQQYLETNAQLNYLNAEYQRQKTLFDEQITSQKNYLKAESDLKMAQATLNGLRAQLQMLNFSIANIEAGTLSAVANIYAPISGVVSKMNVSMGTFVSDGTEILEILDTEHVHLELNVFEKDIINIKKGQAIQFTIPEASKQSFEAEVYLVGVAIEPNRTIKVHGHLLDEDNHNFLTGMFVDAQISTTSSFQLAIPEIAVVEMDNKNYVLKLIEQTTDNYQFEKVEIEIGSRFNGFIVINNTSFSGETQFLANGAFNLITE